MATVAASGMPDSTNSFAATGSMPERSSIDLNSSAVRWLLVPAAEVPKVSLPGSARAAATTSRRLWKRDRAGVTKI